MHGQDHWHLGAEVYENTLSWFNGKSVRSHNWQGMRWESLSDGAEVPEARSKQIRWLNSLDCWTLSPGLLAFHLITQTASGTGKQEPRYLNALTEPGLLLVLFCPLTPGSLAVLCPPSGIGWKSPTTCCSGAWLSGFSWERREFLLLQDVRDLTTPTVVDSGSSNADLRQALNFYREMQNLLYPFVQHFYDLSSFLVIFFYYY